MINRRNNIFVVVILSLFAICLFLMVIKEDMLAIIFFLSIVFVAHYSPGFIMKSFQEDFSDLSFFLSIIVLGYLTLIFVFFSWWLMSAIALFIFIFYFFSLFSTRKSYGRREIFGKGE